MNFTIPSCFSSCEDAQACLGMKGEYHIPLSKIFENTHGENEKKILKKLNNAKNILQQKNKLKDVTDWDILKNVMKLNDNITYVSLDDRIRLEKKKMDQCI